MTPLSPRLLRRGALAAGCIGLAVTATVVAPAFGSTSASRPVAQQPVVQGSRYLALGDSVPFGYREANSIPAPNFTKAKNFIGFPEDVARNLGLTLTNAACPGETTASFINAKAQSNGCENTFTAGAANPVPGGYRTVYPLHAAYKGSQLAFAEAYLKKYPNTRLVTLMIGANDGFICLKSTSDGCFSEFSALQATVTKNVKTIFRGLRDTAHYKGQIALVTYWSLNYRDATSNYETNGLNSALEAAAKPFNVRIANGYGQFHLASEQGHGNPCTAQLLTALSGAAKGTCGVHPSLAGAAVLAQAVERAIKK
jgi:lysophospholipase L1-like esterase